MSVDQRIAKLNFEKDSNLGGAHWEFVARFISKFQKHCFCKDLTFSGTNGLKRHQKAHKMLKKANKGCKGHFKG